MQEFVLCTVRFVEKYASSGLASEKKNSNLGADHSQYS